MKKTNIFGLVLILSTLLIGCAQSNMCADMPEVYTITKNSPEHGTVELSKTSAMVGETITVTANPDAHYQVSEIKVNNSAIEGTSFTMPASNVNVEVNFAQITYKITKVIPAGITVNKATAAFGEEVTVIREDDFQSISTVSISTVIGNQNIDITNNKFIMPEGDVEITISFSGHTSTNVSYYITYPDELSVNNPQGLPYLRLEDLGCYTYKALFNKVIYVSNGIGALERESDNNYIEYIPDSIFLSGESENSYLGVMLKSRF